MAVAVAIVAVALTLSYLYYINTNNSSAPKTSPSAITSPSSTEPSSSTSSPSLTPLPSPRISQDLNWGGYAVATDFNNPQPVVTAVSASWTVPTINVSQSDTFSATWVGIGGTFQTTLIQAGTEQDCIGGQPTYSAWYELLPSSSTTIPNISISPGDSVKLEIRLVDSLGDLWSIYLSNLSNDQSFNQSFYYPSSRLSAEWIVERPDVGGSLSQLADFGHITMDNCTATVNGTQGKIGDLNFIQTDLLNRQGIQLVNISNISGEKTSFTVTWLNGDT